MQTAIREGLAIVDNRLGSFVKSGGTIIAEINHEQKRVHIDTFPTFQEYADIREVARVLQFNVVKKGGDK